MSTPNLPRWEFTIPGNPKPKERPRQGRAGSLSAQDKAAKAAAKRDGQKWADPRRQITITPAETKHYESTVAGAACNADLSVGDRPCCVTLAVWMPTSDAKRKDLDNICKSALDGLMKAGKGALADDCAAVVRKVVLQYMGSDDKPRVDTYVNVMGEEEMKHLPRFNPAMFVNDDGQLTTITFKHGDEVVTLTQQELIDLYLKQRKEDTEHDAMRNETMIKNRGQR